jgi:hypothetical protein
MPPKRARTTKAKVLKPDNTFNRVRKRNQGAASRTTPAPTPEDEDSKLFSTFSPPAMHSTVRMHLGDLRKAFPDQEEAFYRHVAARAAAYEVQQRVLRDDKPAAEEKQAWRLKALADDPSLAILSEWSQRMGHDWQADKELLKLNAIMRAVDRMVIIVKNRLQLFARRDISEIKDFLQTELKEMKAAKGMIADAGLHSLKVREMWPGCEDPWERMMRVQFMCVVSMTGSGMAMAAVDNELADLLEDMGKMGLDEKKDVKETTEKEKMEKAMAMLQKQVGEMTL